ncbi:MAG: response regulator [Polyangiaceae bacterium]
MPQDPPRPPPPPPKRPLGTVARPDPSAEPDKAREELRSRLLRLSSIPPELQLDSLVDVVIPDDGGAPEVDDADIAPSSRMSFDIDEPTLDDDDDDSTIKRPAPVRSAPPPLPPKMARPAPAAASQPTPRADAEPVPSPVVPPAPAVVPVPKMVKAGAKVILVADDDDSIRDLVVRALGMKFTVYEAHNGKMALDMVRAIEPAPDLFVCDIMMPEMDGFAVAKALKADNARKRVPIIFLTARTGAMDVVQGINAGARLYIQKPFKLKDLLDKITQVLGLPKGS